MNYFKHRGQIKLGIFLFGIVIIFTLFWVNWHFVAEIRQDASQQVEHLAVAYSDAINKSEGNDIQYVMEFLLPSINFPIIITTYNEIYAWKNILIDESEGSDKFEERLKKISKRMDEVFTPLEVFLVEDKMMEIHYGDPAIIKQLRWLPYIEIAGVLIFVIFGFFGFQLIRNSEKNFIWAGLAREAAHQLGTPISSLMGWVKLLEDEDEDKFSILKNMNLDVLRLGEVSDRFHKIGSKSQFLKINIYELANEISDYMRSRIPSRSEISIEVLGTNEIVKGEKTLLSWAIENLLKNALDACKGGQEKITVNIKRDKKYVIIDVSDTGTGISRRARNDIFKPGYSTKRRGWGLGLSLTQRIINDIHHGKIKLLRSKPGETVFRILLEIVSDE